MGTQRDQIWQTLLEQLSLRERILHDYAARTFLDCGFGGTRAWDLGRMGRWPEAKQPQSMGYYERADIPFHFALAEAFLRNPGQVLSREQLLERVWGMDFDPGSNVVDVYVSYLRGKLGKQRLETVRGVGYRLV